MGYQGTVKRGLLSDALKRLQTSVELILTEIWFIHAVYDNFFRLLFETLRNSKNYK